MYIDDFMSIADNRWTHAVSYCSLWHSKGEAFVRQSLSSSSHPNKCPTTGYKPSFKIRGL